MGTFRFSGALGIAVFWLCVLPVHAADWPQFMGPNRDLTTPEEAPGVASGGLRLKWRVPLTGGGYGSVAVSQGRVVVVTDKGCEARDADTGVRLWMSPSNSVRVSCHSTPTISGGRVYVNDAATLWCLDLATGGVIWSQPASNHVMRFMRQSDCSHSPLVEDGRVFMFAPGVTNCVLAFNATNGNLLWKGHSYSPTYASPVMATFSGVRQLICQVRQRVVALNPEDGRLLWTQTNFGVHSTPVQSGESLVAPEQNHGVVNVFITNGTWAVTNSWTSSDFCTTWTLPVIKDGYVYDIMSSSSIDGVLRCVRLSDGKVKWSTSGFGMGSVILAGNRLIALAETGWLHVMNATPQSCQVLARSRPLTNGCFNLAAVANGHIYVRNFESLACLDARPFLVGKLSTQTGGGFSLTFRAQDESPVETARVQRIQLQMASTLGTNEANWVPLTSPRVYSNGAVIFTDVPSPPRFFRIYEPNAP